MLSVFRKQQKLTEVYFLVALCIFCFSISIFRLIYTGSGLFLFLNWNLFLAFVPWFFSTLLIVYPTMQKNKLLVFILLIVWLIFFPNAPYILTDLFHLKRNLVMPLWFDLLLILSFAWAGLLLGFISLWNIELLLSRFLHRRIISTITTCLLFVSSFGIYLGRYLRWNSWDLIHRPMPIIYDISDRVANPFQYINTWGMTILMGLFLNIVYWSFKLIRKEKLLVSNTDRAIF